MSPRTYTILRTKHGVDQFLVSGPPLERGESVEVEERDMRCLCVNLGATGRAHQPYCPVRS